MVRNFDFFTNAEPVPVPVDPIGPHARGFREFAEACGFEDIHRDALPFLPAPGVALDVGAGSGRDAAWFARRGWQVVAAEPAAALRQEARRLHPDPAIRFLDDRLPGLPAVHRLGLGFDLVWLSGVWQHLPPEDRPRAMRRLATLLTPGGRLVVTLCHGPAPADRPMWPVDAGEVARLGLDHGLALRVATAHRPSAIGAQDVTWQTVILDLPNDGAGALPLLRGVILRQEKSSTYKLALLRCIARIADASPNVAREAGEEVALPLGLVALYWIRMFKPLVERGLPQRPAGPGGLGFVKDAFRALGPVSPFDLRPGARIGGGLGAALARAMGDAARVIVDMPARHLTDAAGRPVFAAEYGRALPRVGAALALDQALFWRLGEVRVPLGVWRAMRRMAAWIEPMLVAEWVRLVRGYSGGAVSTDAVLAALAWTEPGRDTAFARRLAQGVAAVACVWSGRRLGAGGLDIDHCLPWSAWPCGDLWNLLPAAPVVNRRGKRERIVAAAALEAAKPRILGWWEAAYLGGDPAVRARFAEEARTTLPVAPDREMPDLDEVFAALDFRRLRLRQETQLPEWHGA